MDGWFLKHKNITVEYIADILTFEFRADMS